MTATNGDELEALDDYRTRVRSWIEANLEPRERGSTVAVGPQGRKEQSTSEISANRALQKRLFEAGFAGITWPTEYGGQGLPSAYERVFQEEARDFVMPDLGNLGGATLGVCAPTMLAHASPEFLHHHIPLILAGDELVAQFFSDPDAGSDLAGVRTQATRDGDRWILNGSKIWTGGGHFADVGMCLARTDWDAPKHRGLTWFLVPVGAPGVTIERIRQINGDSEFCQEYFNDVELTDDDIIGQINEGWTVTQTMLLYERGGGMTGGHGGRRSKRTGVARDVLEFAASVSGLDDPDIRDLLAQIHVDDLVRTSLMKRLGARMAADPRSASNLASYAKLAPGVFDPLRAQRAMRIAGRAGIAWDGTGGGPGGAAALAFLNSRFMAIAGGTSQMQRNAIGEKVLGLPREPSFDSRKPFRDVVKDAQNWSGAVG